MKCPVCSEEIPERSRYCNMCGVKLEDAEKIIEQEKRDGRRPMIERKLPSKYGTKTLQVYCSDIAAFPDQIDLLSVSAFEKNYVPVPRTVICALADQKAISVSKLAEKPLLDLRQAANCWISEKLPVTDRNPNIRYIGCVEFASLKLPPRIAEAAPDSEARRLAVRRAFDAVDFDAAEARYLSVLQSYFHLVDILTDNGAEIHTMALPILGSGKQHLNMDIISIPLVSEAIALLQRNPVLQRLVFIEYTYEKALNLVKSIEGSYAFADYARRETAAEHMGTKLAQSDPYVFISYSTNGDVQKAELLAECLRKRNIRYWFAPSDIRSGEYAEAIVRGINQCTHFVCLISQASMQSQHVLNEVDLAFRRLGEGITILPVRLDDSELRASFLYYLARMQWSRGTPPPLEDRFDELIDCILKPE